jgi:hypothetical protein
MWALIDFPHRHKYSSLNTFTFLFVVHFKNSLKSPNFFKVNILTTAFILLRKTKNINRISTINLIV